MVCVAVAPAVNTLCTVVTTEAPDSVTVCTTYTVVGEARTKVVVATACAAGSFGEQTPTPDSFVPVRQMPELPLPELDTPLLLQPLLPVPELGRQVDCGERGRSKGASAERSPRGDACAVESSSSTAAAARQRVPGVSSMAVYMGTGCGCGYRYSIDC